MERIVLHLGLLVLCLSSVITGQTATNTRVVTVLDKLYLIPSEDKTAQGNDKYQGYIKDVLEELGKEIGDLKYTLYLAPDGKYGTKTTVAGKEKWTGIIGEIKDGKADIGAAAITTSADREAVVDFSDGIMSYGITILTKKDDALTTKEMANMTYFFNPFPLLTWILLVVSWIVISVILALYNRFNPYGQHLRSLRREITPVTRQGQGFNIYQTLWYTATGFAVQGGSKWRPLSLSSRVLAVCWWAFCLITFITYIVILILTTPFISTTSETPKLKSFEDLFNSDVKYGVIENGRTYSFLRKSSDPIHQKMLSKLTFVNSTEEGHEKVKNGDFAFIGMSPYLDRFARKDCNMVLVGDLVNKGEYSLALPKNSPMKDKLNSAITKLKSNGRLEALYEKWWEKKSCSSDETEGSSTKVPDTNGIFVFLAIGILFSLLVLLVEVIYFKTLGRRSRGNLDITRDPDDSMMLQLQPK